MRTTRSGARVAVLVILLVTLASLAGPRLHPAQAGAPYQRRVITLSSGRIHSEVALGDLNGDGVDDIVVGSLDGVISAYQGTGTLLWTYNTGSAAIEGKAAIGDIDNDGNNEVVVGIGSTFTPDAPGAVVALSHDGHLKWQYTSKDFDGNGIPEGVRASPALADIDHNDGGKLEIIYGGYDGYIRVLDHDGSLVWERFVRDSIWSSSAIGDLDRDGKPEIAIGVDAHDEPAFGTVDGGRLIVVNAEDGTDVPGFPIAVDETIWSSPVLTDLTGNGQLDIIVGTGNCWANPACAVPAGNTHPVTKVLYGWDHEGKPLPGWPIPLPEYTMASPAVADLDQDSAPEVVINTADGYVHAFEANGSYMPGWPVQVTTPSGPGTVVHYGTSGSPILADLTGDGNPEIILPSNWEMAVFDVNGTQITRDAFPSTKWDLSTEYTVQKTAAVGDVDGDGKIELVVGGAHQDGSPGAIYIWDFDVNASVAVMPWRFGRLNVHNTASATSAPGLLVSPSEVLLMHKYGSGGTVPFSLRIASTTDASVDWTIEAPPGLTPSSASGTSTLSGDAVVIHATIAGLSVRPTPHALGSLEIRTTSSGTSASNTAIVVPVEVLVVEEIHRTFLPLTQNH